VSFFGHIVCDVRERASGVPDLLRADSRLRVDEQVLDSGDYLVAGELGVERKTTADFILSIEGGRLFSQVRKMKARYPRSVMVIEGQDLFSVSRMRKEAIEGALASLAASWQIPVVFATGLVDTARFLTVATFQLGRQVERYYTGRPGRRPNRLHTQRLRVLQAFPGIGPVLAGALLTAFRSPHTFANATRAALQSVPGIGRRRAEHILHVLGIPPDA
jgi:ERCC4-type nuclease